MTTTINHQIRLAARPVGFPTAENWSHTSEPLRTLNDGEIQVKALYLSIDF